MYERDDDELPPSKPDQIQDPIKELKTVAFLLNGLYKQLADERDTIMMASGQMVHAVKQFQGYLAQFEAFDRSLKKHTVDTVYKATQEAAQTIASQVGNTVTEAATKQVEEIEERLRKLVTRAEQQLTGYQQEQENFYLWRWMGFGIVGLCSGLASALAIDYLFPAQVFTKTQYEQMDAGKTLINAWSKLNKKEQDKILRLGKE